MKLWTCEGPWAGRRLAAVNYVSDSSGSPLPGGWGWAACSLECIVTNPLFCPFLRGAPSPIPTIADAEMQKKTLKKESDTNITAEDSRENASQPTVNSTPIIPEETPSDPDDLIADTSARLRWGEHTREPVRHILKGAPLTTPISGAEQLNQCISRGKGEEAS